VAVLFDKVELERLVRLFASRVNEARISGTISLVGGAALSLSYLHDREATTDIDALLPTDLRISEIIAEIAVHENLDKNWINDAAKAYVPFETEAQWVDLYRVGGVLVRIATAELLLAMKLRADRGFRDRPDIEGLIKICGITSISEIEELYGGFHHQEVIQEKTRLVVIGMLKKIEGGAI
jgi:Nucleotidyltransferase of unknown function (DUF6036)